jgi:hypothetical protein
MAALLSLVVIVLHLPFTSGIGVGAGIACTTSLDTDEHLAR